MAYPRTPGGLFPLTTAPTGNNAGGLYPTTDRLVAAIRSLAPTAYWKMDEASGNLADAMSGGYTATVTGSPSYGVAAPSPIGRMLRLSGTGQYATTSGSVPAPAASMSVLAIVRTSTASATRHDLFARSNGSVNSWGLRTSSSHWPVFDVFQASTSSHAAIAINDPINDGRLRLLCGTFDGTTVRCHSASDSGIVSGSSTSLTGSWNRASTEAVSIGSIAGSTPFEGDAAHFAYLADRIVGLDVIRWLWAIVRGG